MSPPATYTLWLVVAVGWFVLPSLMPLCGYWIGRYRFGPAFRERERDGLRSYYIFLALSGGSLALSVLLASRLSIADASSIQFWIINLAVVCSAVLLLGLLMTGPVLFIDYVKERPPPGGCYACGYDLTGNASGICPECGTRIKD